MPGVEMARDNLKRHLALIVTVPTRACIEWGRSWVLAEVIIHAMQNAAVISVDNKFAELAFYKVGRRLSAGGSIVRGGWA